MFFTRLLYYCFILPFFITLSFILSFFSTNVLVHFIKIVIYCLLHVFLYFEMTDYLLLNGMVHSVTQYFEFIYVVQP